VIDSANIELVQAFVDGYNRGEFDVVFELCAPDVEGYPDASVFPEPKPRIGHAELNAFLEEIGSAWAEPPRYVLTEVIAVGDDRVLTRGDWRGRGAASGIESYSEWSTVWTIRERQISRIAWLSDHNEALEAVGLSEDDPAGDTA
jgi:ketosteroid isomerase-like protein